MLPRLLFPLLLLTACEATPEASDAPPLDETDSPTRPSVVEDRFTGDQDAYPLSTVPIVDPWAMEVELHRDEEPVSVEALVSCLVGDEDVVDCRAVYNPARNEVALVDVVPGTTDEVVIRYRRREDLPR